MWGHVIVLPAPTVATAGLITTLKYMTQYTRCEFGGREAQAPPALSPTSMAGSVLLASVLLSPRMLPAERPSHS